MKVKLFFTWNPMCVFCPLAMYFPVFETVMTEISLSWPYQTKC